MDSLAASGTHGHGNGHDNGHLSQTSAVRSVDDRTSSRPAQYPRKRLLVACEICRVRKTRCDGVRPRCSSCARLGATCEYRATSKRQPSQTTPFTAVTTRLERIESLLTSTTATYRSVSNRDGASPASPVDVPQLNTAIDILGAKSPARTDGAVGRLDIAGISHLAGHECPPCLAPLVGDTDEDYLLREIEQGRQLFHAKPLSECYSEIPDLSPRTCWRLHQSYIVHVLPWFPLFNQQACAQMITQACDSGFLALGLPRVASRRDGVFAHNASLLELSSTPHHVSIPGAIISLFILALGALSQQDQYFGDQPHEMHGLNFFLIACELESRESRANPYDIRFVQCKILKCLYLLLCLRPLQAHEALVAASNTVLTILQLHRTLASDHQLRESCNRAYWIAYILELELRNYDVLCHESLLAQQAYVTLPVSDHDETGMFWLLSEIALRRWFQNIDEALGFTDYTTYLPVIVEELGSQLAQWHHNLPSKIRFSLGTDLILDPQMRFLRAQYYSAVCMINWPAVVRYLSLPTDDTDLQKLLHGVNNFVESAINYIHAAETLLLERYVMLFAKHTGMFAITMMLLCCYEAPGLESVQHMDIGPTVQKAHSLLSAWTACPGINAKVARLYDLMRNKGVVSIVQNSPGCTPR